MVGPIVSLPITGDAFNFLKYLLLDILPSPKYGQVDGHDDGCPFNC